MRSRTTFLLALSGALIGAFFFVDPIPQDPSYHAFADTRPMLGIPNFWNVASNIPFLLVGGAGLYTLASGRSAGMLPDLSPAYAVFFAGIVLTGVGSAYYHYSPTDSTLVWDRLSMTIGFMGLFTIIVGEHVSRTAARRLLIPLLVVGAASVVYWSVTEERGSGDLRPYAIVQFLPMLLIPLILLMYRSVFGSVTFLWVVILLYAFSKLFEYFDAAVFGFGELISGHSLKHIVAAMAPLAVLHGLNSRRPFDEVARS